MIAHVLDALRPQVSALVVCGREWAGEVSIRDLRDDMAGPLAGLEAALRHARQNGFDAVLSVPVDTLPLPHDLTDRLQGDGAAVFEIQHLIGYWPVSCASALSDYLDAGDRAMAGWKLRCSARIVREPFAIANINRPEDIHPAR